MIYDILVIGSGACGVQAAYSATKAGFRVGMIDFGNDEDSSIESFVPGLDFWNIRQSDKKQHRYFLGDHFDGIPVGDIPVGAQLTPPRQYITKDSDQLLPTDSESFFPLQSLAVGGLARGWGANAPPLNADDLSDFPIGYDDLSSHYEKIAKRIGISGMHDDLLPFYGECQALQDPLELDENGISIFSEYFKKKRRLNQKGFYIGRSRQAVLTKEYRNRDAHQYYDMSFWSDKDESVYRPHYTLRELKQFTNFNYHRPLLAHTFVENTDKTVEITCFKGSSDDRAVYRARRVIIAAGALSTTRIVLRSLNKYDIKIPILSNPYTYVPTLNLNMLGKIPSERNHSFAQLAAVMKPPDPAHPLIHMTVHSYRSLLNFKLAKESPLPFPESMELVRMVVPALAVIAFSHEDRPTQDKFCILRRATQGERDRLEISYISSDEDIRRQDAYERKILRQFLKLKCIAFKKIRPGHAASIHYGGSLPMNDQGDDLTVDRNCKLAGTHSVYIADASVFPVLPSKGQTFAAMANANRISEHICQTLKRA